MKNEAEHKELTAQELYERVGATLDQWGWPDCMQWIDRDATLNNNENDYLGFADRWGYRYCNDESLAIIERHLMDKVWQKWPNASIERSEHFGDVRYTVSNNHYHPIGKSWCANDLLDALLAALEER